MSCKNHKIHFIVTLLPIIICNWILNDALSNKFEWYFGPLAHRSNSFKIVTNLLEHFRLTINICEFLFASLKLFLKLEIWKYFIFDYYRPIHKVLYRNSILEFNEEFFIKGPRRLFTIPMQKFLLRQL